MYMLVGVGSMTSTLMYMCLSVEYLLLTLQKEGWVSACSKASFDSLDTSSVSRSSGGTFPSQL